jgi:hypothetical protein
LRQFLLSSVLVAATLPVAGSLAASPITPPGGGPPDNRETFVLQDYLWVPVIVRKPPTTIACSFTVVSGNPGVHAELLSNEQFFLFSRRRAYEPVAATAIGRTGSFEHIVQTPGRYRVLLINGPGAPPAGVSMKVSTTVDPPAGLLSTGIPPARKRTVIFASLAFFAGTVWWSGSRLLRAWSRRQAKMKET